ncbi:hypothetical protein RHECNPAF_1700068 [Rhizobium etli CNPAF512]|nr:hypothetical protein RHECNPAF_1700068 [Rhizobium etli CNPAF512]
MALVRVPDTGTPRKMKSASSHPRYRNRDRRRPQRSPGSPWTASVRQEFRTMESIRFFTTGATAPFAQQRLRPHRIIDHVAPPGRMPSSSMGSADSGSSRTVFMAEKVKRYLVRTVSNCGPSGFGSVNAVPKKAMKPVPCGKTDMKRSRSG